MASASPPELKGPMCTHLCTAVPVEAWRGLLFGRQLGIGTPKLWNLEMLYIFAPDRHPAALPNTQNTGHPCPPTTGASMDVTSAASATTWPEPQLGE